MPQGFPFTSFTFGDFDSSTASNEAVGSRSLLPFTISYLVTMKQQSELANLILKEK
jgi:hypothetical protein